MKYSKASINPYSSSGEPKSYDSNTSVLQVLLFLTHGPISLLLLESLLSELLLLLFFSVIFIVFLILFFLHDPALFIGFTLLYNIT